MYLFALVYKIEKEVASGAKNRKKKKGRGNKKVTKNTFLQTSKRVESDTRKSFRSEAPIPLSLQCLNMFLAKAACFHQKQAALANRKGVVFHKDNARPHTAKITRETLARLQ